MSKDNPTAQWPPRSPHEALLSTPGGRDRLRRMAERASPSPSPSKRPAPSSIRRRADQILKLDMGQTDDEEDDEETLQLKLEEIQAKLKLKKMQKKQKLPSDLGHDEVHGTEEYSTQRTRSETTSRTQSRMAARRDELLDRPTSQNTIHVPMSPVRRTQHAVEQKSPSRVLLGIDKGLKGSDVSLKRAPSLRKRVDGESLAGPFLQRPSSQTSYQGRGTGTTSSQEVRPKSFSERMAALRSQDTEKEQRQLRVKRSRSQAFDIGEEQMQTFKQRAVELPDLPQPAREFSREEILNSTTNSRSTGVTRSRTTPNLQSANTTSSVGRALEPGISLKRTASQASFRKAAHDEEAAPKEPPTDVSEADATQFEPFSARHLSKRIIPHHVLTRTLSGKKTFQIPDLLRVVKSPDFSLPDIEEDIVVFGIIAQKSEPRAHAPNGKTQSRGKYMAMTLTDLKWEVDLFLFDSGFEKFWKLSPGTIIAILNPGVMPPTRGKADTGKFSLTVNSEADTILEVGTARDLGFCKSVKRDGKTCDSWVDKRHTEFCDYHVNETLKKTASKRMEINTMAGYGARKFNPQDMTGRIEKSKKAELEKRTRWDKESHSQIFIGKPSTANLLDNVDFDPDPFHRGSSKEQRVMRQVLAQEKERELAKKLGAVGGGLGADYMKLRDRNSTVPNSSMSSDAQVPPPSDAASLGLLSGKAGDVALSPIKRKRVTTMAGTTAMGWGSDLTKKLGDMRNGEKMIGQQKVEKKTRFLTEKGIREAGRESFGGELPAKEMAFDDDDDDDLDIVRE